MYTTPMYTHTYIYIYIQYIYPYFDFLFCLLTLGAFLAGLTLRLKFDNLLRKASTLVVFCVVKSFSQVAIAAIAEADVVLAM